MMRRFRTAVLTVLVLAGLVALTRAQQGVPRAEFPQPQFERERWLTLNGTWEFDFDDKNVGVVEGWGSSMRAFARTIVVPYCFESQLSGIGDPSFHPWLWYRRAFTVPAEWKGQRVLLNFGAVHYRARVWVNGQMAGSHEGGQTSFRFDVTPYLKPGPNTLTVRAENMPTDRSIPRGKQFWEVKSRSIFYTRTSGIWQPVWLEAAGESYLEEVRILPAVDGAVRFEATIARAQLDLELRAAVKPMAPLQAPGTKPAAAPVEVASAGTRVAGDRAVLGAIVPEPRLWSPRSPNLYEVTFELRRGTSVLDRVQSYFGFRTSGTEDGRFVLNGEPYYLKLLLDQGYWPESVMTPPTDAAMQVDIRLAKDMGFNGVRKHQKVEDPRFLYWADRMGLLVSGEIGNAYVFTDQYVSRITREWMEAVARDRNHPSLVIWAPINESWGVPTLREPRQQAHLREMYWLTHTLDGTRPVIDNEGWEHTETTDLFAVHDYARTGDDLLERYKPWGGATALPPRTPIPSAGTPVLAPGAHYNGSPLYLSEFGGIAFIPPGHQVAGDAWGYAGVEKSQDAALARLGGLYRAIARIPAFAGVCYTQITDVEQEINGLLTNDRKPKFDVKAVREFNEMLR
jgi:beta-galactosidase/beta-glucuronidase